MDKDERVELSYKIQEQLPIFQRAKEEIGKVIVGQEHVIDHLLIALLCDGHVIIEGLPGLAKTLTVKTLSQVLKCDFSRIQFTPDLLPADLIGTTIYNPKEGTFSVKKGPIFTNILLADEINRAPAKVQSALLEVMQERQVTISGETFKTESPYLVLATQNPIEQEGTYPLPEAQTDRFMMKVNMGYPSQEEEKKIMKRVAGLDRPPSAKPTLDSSTIIKTKEIVEQIYLDEKVFDYIIRIIIATRESIIPELEGLIMYGASPRASLALKMGGKAHAFFEGREYVKPEDIKAVGHNILRHRIRRSYEAEAEDISTDQIIDMIFEKVPVL